MDLSELFKQYQRHEIAGFDISLNSTGVSYYDHLEEVFITSLIKPKMTGKTGLNHITRLHYIAQRAQDFCRTMSHIKLAVIEDYAMGVGKAKQSGLAVREAGGIIKNVLHSNGV
ncbi:MAG: hypothetical protein LPH21_15910, partial [Shewanella sp.]|nr:hypothetical protein [Shewanella sp.]